MDANGNPVRIFVTAGTTADCTLEEDLIRGIDALALLADKGDDANALIEFARSMGMEVVIPPKKTGKSSAIMTKTDTNCATWLKTLF